MRFWLAVSRVLHVRRNRRIGGREAEDLLRGITTTADRAELLRLLALAAAPPQPDELVGHDAALAAFRTAPEPAPARSRRHWWTLASRALLVKVLAGFGVLLVGGAAVAAGTGSLPTGVQHGAHALLSPLGVQVPDATRSGVTSRPQHTGWTPTPGPVTASTSTPAGLCQAWRTAKGKPGKGMDPGQRQALIKAAGGMDQVAAYCTRVLGPEASSSPSPTPAPDPTTKPKPRPSHKPSHPAKSKAKPSATARH